MLSDEAHRQKNGMSLYILSWNIPLNHSTAIYHAFVKMNMYFVFLDFKSPSNYSERGSYEVYLLFLESI